MAVEAGQIARGTVVHLMPYGALVRLDEGTTGLVHISEIAQDFVHNVADVLQKGDSVIVKILASGEKGKTELSIKQAIGQEVTLIVAEPVEQKEVQPEPPPPSLTNRRESRAMFEDKMRDFLNDSSDRLTDVRRHSDSKLGNRKPR